MNKIHLRIGGAKDNQLVIESVDIAPYHLELFCDTSGNVFITDLNSEQGTFVNNRRLNGFQLLKKGDRVRFGQNYNFPWEEFIPVQSNKNTEVRKEIKEEKERVNVQSKKQVAASNPTSVNNTQLYVIYGCIIFLLILLSLYL
jgi:pSer/pThr/pTyr-binding forkhead associated (FHA) protein